jgi:hypothetical protein
MVFQNAQLFILPPLVAILLDYEKISIIRENSIIRWEMYIYSINMINN